METKRKMSFEEAKRQYVRHFTMEHVPAWAGHDQFTGRFYAPQYRTDREWYYRTVFPGEPGHDGNSRYCYSTGQTWPLGQWLGKPYRKPVHISGA